jgi:hypothetical protein
MLLYPTASAPFSCMLVTVSLTCLLLLRPTSCLPKRAKVITESPHLLKVEICSIGD